ncbi:biotin--[acetyl-CoA-carboxylase] ligase [Acidocella sp.]|uniref:biotin--[acetyl-CoA-carboxylase] ligase n=2 Tax=Acidocella sp. TaxID=50710 RepID=UPI00260AF5AE|nr:biotin--[acetyl-CoA-carboxylase] ligase [Acidocella sp.]
MISWRLEQFEQLGSTSDHCIQAARNGEAEGLAVLALAQTSGRGSRGRAWEAPSGNLNLSVLLRPARPLAEAGMFPLLAGLAVHETLTGFGLETATLKWPNDVLVGGAKLAGILIDAQPGPERFDWLVIGIGVNLLTAPEIPGRLTTSLARYGIAVTPAAFTARLLPALSRWLAQPAEAITQAWSARAHAPGTALSVHTSLHNLTGRFAGLSRTGELLLAIDHRIETISTGEIFLAAS